MESKVSTVHELNGEIVAQAQTFEQESRSLVVIDKGSYEDAALKIKAIDSMIDVIHAELDDNIAKANELHKALTSQRKRHLDPLLGAKAIINNKRAIWKLADDRRRQLEAQEAHDKAEAEARAKQEADAKAAYKAGERKKAATIKTAPIIVPSIAVEAAPKIEGESIRKRLIVRVVDEKLVPIRFRPVCEHCIAMMQREVDALGSEVRIPGIELEEKITFVRRS